MFCFRPRDTTDTTIRKIQQRNHGSLSEKPMPGIKERQAAHFCAYVVQIRGKKFRSNSQNRARHRNNATCSHHYLFNVYQVRTLLVLQYLFFDGDELGSATDIDRLQRLQDYVYSTIPNFTLIWNDDFWSWYTYFGPKLSPK